VQPAAEAAEDPVLADRFRSGEVFAEELAGHGAKPVGAPILAEFERMVMRVMQELLCSQVRTLSDES
jgi:hypothetical protein